MNILKLLIKNTLIQAPSWASENTCLLSRVGSYSYGVNTEDSDIDVCGIVIPPKEIIFPYDSEYILGFGTKPQNFETYQQHHIKYENNEYDITLYSIVKFFELCRQGNPNLIDILFTPDDCIISINDIGRLIRDSRKLFLSQSLWPKFKGFCFNHLKGITNKNKSNSRSALVETHSYDTKSAGHLVRTILNLRDILVYGDFDPRQHKDTVLDVRNGKWTLDEVTSWFAEQEKSLEIIKSQTCLPEIADEQKIRKVLRECIEMQYGKKL